MSTFASKEPSVNKLDQMKKEWTKADELGSKGWDSIEKSGPSADAAGFWDVIV